MSLLDSKMQNLIERSTKSPKEIRRDRVTNVLMITAVVFVMIGVSLYARTTLPFTFLTPHFWLFMFMVMALLSLILWHLASLEHPDHTYFEIFNNTSQFKIFGIVLGMSVVFSIATYFLTWTTGGANSLANETGILADQNLKYVNNVLKQIAADKESINNAKLLCHAHAGSNGKKRHDILKDFALTESQRTITLADLSSVPNGPGVPATWPQATIGEALKKHWDDQGMMGIFRISSQCNENKDIIKATKRVYAAIDEQPRFSYLKDLVLHRWDLGEPIWNSIKSRINLAKESFTHEAEHTEENLNEGFTHGYGDEHGHGYKHEYEHGQKPEEDEDSLIYESLEHFTSIHDSIDVIN